MPDLLQLAYLDFQTFPRPCTVDLNKITAMETIEKRIEKSLIFQHHFSKILLNKLYNCVLCEKCDKLFCFLLLKNKQIKKISLRMSFAVFMMVPDQF